MCVTPSYRSEPALDLVRYGLMEKGESKINEHPDIILQDYYRITGYDERHIISWKIRFLSSSSLTFINFQKISTTSSCVIIKCISISN